MGKFRWKGLRIGVLSLWGGLIGCAAPSAPVWAPPSAPGDAAWASVRFYDETGARAAKTALLLSLEPAESLAPASPSGTPPAAWTGAPADVDAPAPEAPGEASAAPAPAPARTPAPDLQGPRLSDIEIRPLGPTSVLLRWRTDELATRGVEVGPTSLLGIASPPAEASWGKGHRVVISGLPSGRKGFFRLLARDAAGNQTASAVLSFKLPSRSRK